MANAIAQIQEEITARLNADPYFVDITVVSERVGNIDNEITRALGSLNAKASKSGVIVVVATVNGDVKSPDVPGPYFEENELSITVLEMPTVNTSATGTAKAAVDIAVMILQVLHHYYAAGIGQTMYAAREALRGLGEVQPGIIGYRVRMAMPADKDALSKVATPTIAAAAFTVPQSVTLACGTSGASIYYTLDGTYPWSGNAAAVLYSAPFTVSTAAQLRVVAHKSGLVASDAAAATFT